MTKGYWMEENPRRKGMTFTCSQCHGRAWYPQTTLPTKRCGYKYCPNCGIRMDDKTVARISYVVEESNDRA